MEHRSIDHPPMQPSSQRGVGASLEKQAQRHQMDANGLDSARILAVWTLDGVGGDDELMKGHTPQIPAATDWQQIVTLYDQLLALQPTPIVALNRAVAVGEVDGPAAALALVDNLHLSNHHRFHAVRAELLLRLGQSAAAAAAYDQAITRADNATERAHLERRRRDLNAPPRRPHASADDPSFLLPRSRIRLRTPTCTVRIPLVRGEHFAYTQGVSPAPPLSVSEARRHLAAIIDRVGVEHAPVYLARRGRRVAAVIDADDLDRILALAEDMADIRAAEEAREEMRATGEAPIPWEQVKADLGLV